MVLKFSSRGHGTAVRIAFISIHAPLVLAGLLAGVVMAQFRYWGAISGMASVALGMHIYMSNFCLREQQETADDLIGIISGAVTVETTQTV